MISYEEIEAGLEDSRHLARVPGLEAVRPGLLGERAGFRTVIDAAAAGRSVPWYNTRIDRMYSVDSTFAHLVMALDDGDVRSSASPTASTSTGGWNTSSARPSSRRWPRISRPSSNAGASAGRGATFAL